MGNNPELDTARRIVENTGTHLFLTGKAGTGKTTFLRELKRTSPKRMIVLAPTGIAAINAEGMTIHSFFQLPSHRMSRTAYSMPASIPIVTVSARKRCASSAAWTCW